MLNVHTMTTPPKRSFLPNSHLGLKASCSVDVKFAILEVGKKMQITGCETYEIRREERELANNFTVAGCAGGHDIWRVGLTTIVHGHGLQLGVVGSLRSAWGWYQMKLAQQPVRTQMVTSGILWATGDYAAQSISRGLERRRVSNSSHVVGDKKVTENTDWKRVALASSFGVGFVGPVGHLWYEGLESFVIHGLKLRVNSVRFIATKVACDCLLFGPIHLVAFFTYMGLMSGRPWEKVKRDVERDFIPTYMTEGLGWAVVQVANFRLVPVRHQLLYVNVFCLVDSAFLSWVKYQDDAPWKKYLTSLVTRAKPSESSATR